MYISTYICTYVHCTLVTNGSRYRRIAYSEFVRGGEDACERNRLTMPGTDFSLFRFVFFSSSKDMFKAGKKPVSTSLRYCPSKLNTINLVQFHERNNQMYCDSIGELLEKKRKSEAIKRRKKHLRVVRPLQPPCASGRPGARWSVRGHWALGREGGGRGVEGRK